MDVFRPCSWYSSIATCPCGNQSTGATLTASAQLKPQLNPEWYARGKVRTNSPGFWQHLYTGTPLDFSIEGESCVTWMNKQRRTICFNDNKKVVMRNRYTEAENSYRKKYMYIYIVIYTHFWIMNIFGLNFLAGYTYMDPSTYLKTPNYIVAQLTSLWSKSGCSSNRSGRCFLITSSNLQASLPGIPYHNFGAPQCM